MEPASFKRIARDTRHNRLQIIFSEITSRDYGDWAMHGIGLFDLNRDLVFRLSLKFGELNGNVRFPDRADQASALVDELIAHGNNTSRP